MTAVDALTPLQQFYADAIVLGLGAGMFALGLIVFLLAVLAVRSLGSR